MSLVYRGFPLTIEEEAHARTLLAGGPAAADLLVSLVNDGGLGVWWTSEAGEVYSHAEAISGDYDLSIKGAVEAADRGEGFWGAETSVVLAANAPTAWEQEDWQVPEGSPIDLAWIKYTIDPMDDTAWRTVPVGRRTLTASSGVEIEVQGPDWLDGFSVYARVGGQIVGRLTGGKWNAVEKVWVDPTHRRKGIATQMYRALEEAAAKAGFEMRRPDEFSDAGAAWYSNLTGKEYYSTWGSDVDWTDWSRRTASATGLFWRVHPAGRPFGVEDATSTPFYDPNPPYQRTERGGPLTQRGYSCFANAWHLWVYTMRMGWGRVGTDVIGFSGTDTGEKGSDGEDLAVPDMRTVRRMSWDEFERTVLPAEPFPPTPAFARWVKGFEWKWLGSWDETARQLAYLGPEDAADEEIIRRHPQVRTATGSRKGTQIGTYFHASPDALPPGIVLVPHPDVRFPQAHPGRVYLTPDPWVALGHHGGVTAYLDGRTHLYRVQPHGSVEDDPEAVAVGKTGQSYMAASATVLSEVNVEEFAEMEGLSLDGWQRTAALPSDIRFEASSTAARKTALHDIKGDIYTLTEIPALVDLVLDLSDRQDITAGAWKNDQGNVVSRIEGPSYAVTSIWRDGKFISATGPGLPYITNLDDLRERLGLADSLARESGPEEDAMTTVIEDTKPLRDTAACKICDCTEYVEESVIGQYPTCQCGHTENSHWVPSSKKPRAKRASSSAYAHCPACRGFDADVIETGPTYEILDCTTCGTVWSTHDGQTWEDVGEYERDREGGFHEGRRIFSLPHQAARPGDTRKGLSALLGATVAFPDGKTGTIMDLAPITNPDGPKRVEREIANYNWRSPRYREVEIPTQKAIVPGIPASKIEACWVESGGQVYWAAVHVPDMTVVDSHLTPQRLVARLRRQAVTTSLWPVTGYGDLVHVVLGNPEDTDSAPEATKITLCGQVPWAFQDWSVMPFDGEDYRPISDAEDARQVTCPACRQAAETSVRTASRKTAAGWSAADVRPGRGSWDGLPLYRDGTPIHINDQVLTPDGKPGTVSSILPKDFLLPGKGPVGVTSDDIYDDRGYLKDPNPGPAPTYWPDQLTPVKTVYQHHPQGPPRLTLGQLRTLALGEARVPAQVDTLRDDSCPVCGSTDYRGENCNSCGYVKPPVIFHDPNTDKARLDSLRSPKVSVDLACDNCGAVYLAQSDSVMPEQTTPGVVASRTAASDSDRIPEPPPLPGQGEDEEPEEEADTNPVLENSEYYADGDEGTEQTTQEAPAQEAVVPAPETAPEAPATPPPGGPTHVPEQGDLCPSCGQGTLMPKDEIDGIELSDVEEAIGNLPAAPLSDEGADLEEEVEVPFGATASRVRSPRGRQKEKSMTNQSQRPRQGLHTALREQQQQIASQGRLLRRQALVTDQVMQQNQMLRQAVLHLARSSGNRAVVASLTTKANDAQNHEPVALTDDTAAAPDATTDVETPGAAPASVNEGVTPEATTTLTEQGVALDTEPLNELVDVQQVHEQTGDPVGTTTDVSGPQKAAETSNPIEESGWTNTASKGERTWAALNLAKRRVAAGLSTEDPVVLAQQIEKDASVTVEAMETEISTLERVAKAAAGTDVPRNLVPRSAQRVPSLAPTTASTAEPTEGVNLDDTIL